MSEQFNSVTHSDLVHWVGHRGAVNHHLGLVLVEASLATTEQELENPQTVMVALRPEIAEKLIASLQQSLGILRQSS